MNRLRRLILATPVAFAVAGVLPLRAEPLQLSTISEYMEGLRTAEGRFTQIASDGSVQTGTIYIKRPGRIRFEYDPPEQSMVIAGGGSLAIFDPRSNTGPERYPLSETPLNILLGRNVDLARSGMVVAHTSDGTMTAVTLQDPDHPDYGTIELQFTDPPALQRWIITDNGGGRTTITLGSMTVGGNIPERLFNITAEAESWGR